MGKGASIARTIFELAQGGSVDVVGSVPNPFSPKNHQWNFVDCGPLAGCSAIPWPSSLTITPMAAGENTWSRR
ncbi:MAG: hypothetical protein LRY67_02145 [Gammaproteobacteria bacterium]|nr:hypothetical protein [Gammaproteobacteria bacterium]